MKKIKLFALAAFAMLSTNASADELLTKFSGANGVEYQIVKTYTPAAGFNDAVNGQVVVVSYSQSATTDPVTIPATIKNTNNAIAADVPLDNVYDVVGIAGYKDKYKNNGAGQGVVDNTAVDAQVTVFQGCKSTSITLPASLQTIGHHAFWGCEATTITLPAQSRLLEIGDAAFMGAKNLATFATSNAGYLGNVGADAFYGCAALTEFSATQNLEDIGDGAFIGTGITKLDLSSCKLFTNAHTVTISRWFTEVATKDLASYTALAAASKAALYTAAPKYAAADATNSKLATVILPTALETPATDVLAIDANAFDGCTALATIGATANTAVIPAFISTIGAGAFLKTNITKFDMSANAITTIGVWFSKTGDAVADPSKLEQVILNSSTTAPVTYASFAGLTGISTLKKIGITGAEYTLPGATTVGAGKALAEGVFAGTAIEQLDLSKIANGGTAYALPALFYRVAAGVFNGGNASLTAVVLNEKVNELAANAFAGCPLLASLTVKKADGTAVENLTTLATVNASAFWQTKLSSLTFGVALEGLTTPFVKPTTATTEAQGKLALSEATSLSIDLSACTGLKGVINGAAAAAKILGEEAFKGVAALTSIKLPANLTNIGKSAFEGTGITTIDLPATLVQNLDGTTKPNVLATATRITLGLGANAFKDCKSLTTVSFEPAAVTGTIFAYDGIYDDAGTGAVDEKTYNVFRGCNLVTFATSTEYSALFDGNTATTTTHPIPVNLKMDKATSKIISTKMDKKTNGYAMKGFYDDANSYKIKVDDVTTVYEAYLDEGDVVLSRLRKKSGFYEIPAGLAVIVRTSEAKDVTPIKDNGIVAPGSSLLTLAGNELKSVAKDKTAKPEANYIYALTNKTGEGFAFSFYTGATLNNGSIYVISSKVPSASGRLNIVFLDEDGNIEDEATAIKSIEKKADNNGVRYNLAGQKVGASYKGVVIKDGKKYIQK